ncbi:BatD family protein [Legionella sp.]|uniref:BatD family protein n=1 Tax=Legionella sp. TaxID=459 RepID=UPI003CACD23B
MNKLLIIGLCCLFSFVAKAEVQSQVNTSQVSLDETFNLSLTQNNLPNGGSSTPDLTPLYKDFLILGSARSISYSVINGQTQSSSTWTITLKAQNIGTLTIPTIQIGTEQTSPLTITVTPIDPAHNASDTTKQQQDVLLTTEVSEKKPYVNQQITYKVALYNAQQLLNANYQAPKIENGLLISLGREKHYQTQKNNRQYLVEEQNYAIFPQKSGPLKITSPVFTGLLYSTAPKKITAENKPITLDVQPIPQHYTGKEWLPAKQVKLTEQYENVAQTLNQGTTLVRTVKLEGVGIPAQLLPIIDFAATDAFNVYPEKGIEKNQILGDELVSTTEIKVTYLFNKNGTITIPELKLPWFNTETGKEEIATLAPRSIEVTPSTIAPTESNTNQPADIKAPKEDLLTTVSESPPQIQNYWAWLIAGIFALAWLITLSLWGWQKRTRNTKKGAYKKVLSELHSACMQADPQRARDALLKWGSLYWPEAPMLNLNDFTHLVTDVQLKKQTQALSQALYQEKKISLWRGDELWRSIQGIKPANHNQPPKANVLPPIHPF